MLAAVVVGGLRQLLPVLGWTLLGVVPGYIYAMYLVRDYEEGSNVAMVKTFRLCACLATMSAVGTAIYLLVTLLAGALNLSKPSFAAVSGPAYGFGGLIAMQVNQRLIQALPGLR